MEQLQAENRNKQMRIQKTEAVRRSFGFGELKICIILQALEETSQSLLEKDALLAGPCLQLPLIPLLRLVASYRDGTRDGKECTDAHFWWVSLRCMALADDVCTLFGSRRGSRGHVEDSGPRSG